ncbi:alpha/beta-hydrolase [Sporormia fimetaria CBS 119925]|uniref:Alpha/beta-hydrolase n=1 Tax=Sporormia fimetaria CBS 119925 TaxID=1340428 RepID=A0A6A6VBM1_9PLEO|nr:alpha/beta-hydrolase [Sporormia fimetaria CBS 119925]
MFHSGLSILAAVGGLAGIAQAQFPPTPEDVTVLESKLIDGARISYKENTLCETTDGVKSYAGYVHLPPGALEELGVRNQTYEINTFFWFFESRKDPANAPLSIWLNGGPGSSSMLGLMREHGPCFVNDDSNSTTLNQWSWNNEVNMLYLDQPANVGLSYSDLQNVTVSTSTGDVEVADFSESVPEQNNTFYVGTYGSQNPNDTTQGTMNSARAMWMFAQTWFTEFPGYKPNNNKVSISTESYGGRYGPAFMAYFQEQNEKIRNGSWTERGQTHILELDNLLIINGCVDRLVQWPGYVTMAYNNSYGIQAYNESRYEEVMDNLNREGGCLDQIRECRELAVVGDPTNQGFNSTVNKVCQEAESFCSENIRDPYFDSDLNYYDISSPGAAAFPVPWYTGYLVQPHVQQGLGVPLNWTQSNGAVSRAFRAIGDYPRPGWKEDLEYLLDSGVKVSLQFGDKDYACNWYGGELLSLAIDYEFSDEFRAAGYAPIEINSTYTGGMVRQYGNLSFARVFNAGHEVPAYQPETAYELFQRLTFDRDLATGKISTLGDDYAGTEGAADTFNITQVAEPAPAPTCYVLDRGQCTDEQWESVENGTALVRNWIVVDANTSHLFPDLPQASGTPTPTDFPGAARGRFEGGWTLWGREVPVAVSVGLSAVFGSLVVML